MPQPCTDTLVRPPGVSGSTRHALPTATALQGAEATPAQGQAFHPAPQTPPGLAWPLLETTSVPTPLHIHAAVFCQNTLLKVTDVLEKRVVVTGSHPEV